jgi:hypothetical protein
MRVANFITLSLMLFVLRTSASVLYVDVNSANPAPPYADLTTAAVSIQDAVDAATNGDLILVNDGVYQNGHLPISQKSGILPPSSLYDTNRVAICKRITVQSLNGPVATCINGGGIYRCVFLTNGAALNGFTLTNGAVGWMETNISFGRTITTTNTADGGGVAGGFFGGGALSNCVLAANTAIGNGGGAYAVTLMNCTLTGNMARSGGGAGAATLINCIVTNNSAQTNGNTGSGGPFPTAPVGFGGGINASSAINCLIANNRAFEGGGAANALNLANCTMVNNSAAFSGGVFGDGSFPGSHVTNCIIYHNAAGTNANFTTGNISIDHSCTFPLPAGGVGNLTNDPAFVDYSGSDFHLQTNSLCINSGYNAAITQSSDLDGNPRIQGGTVDIGVYEFQSPTTLLSYAWARQYGLAVDGSADHVDTDGDGMDNWQEFLAGTNPTNAASFLAMSSAIPVFNLHWVVVKWQSVDTRTYYLQRSTNLGAPTAFSTIQSNISGQAGTTIFTDTTATNGGSFFYRVGVQ